jgi:hypothetical protein
MPESASFSVRKRPNYRRRRTLTVVVLLGVAVIVIALLSRGGTSGSKKNPIAQVAFVTKVVTQPQAKAPSSSDNQSNADAILKMFNDYYQTAFVDPKKWGDGTFPDLKDLFVKEAQTSFTKDIDSLTIGPARTELSRVDPTKQTMTLTIYYDAKTRPYYAVADATFIARGTMKQSGPPLIIDQKATYYLHKVGDSWTITDYDVSQTQVTLTPSPSPSAS